MISSRTGNCFVRGREINFDRPHVMGVLNCTPDSFSDGGRFVDVTSALARLRTMSEQGASMVDVGGESTRPGSDPVPAEEELRRVMPVLEAALPEFPNLFFSIDTTKFEVAEAALSVGVHFINDVSGLRSEPRFVDLAADNQAGLILMHSRGNPKTMQNNPVYLDVCEEVYSELEAKADYCERSGVPCVIVDPGFGFSKNLDHNLELLRNLDQLAASGRPVLAGMSRKSMLGQILGGRSVDQRLTATISAHFYAMMKGARIIRVHDVSEAVDSVKVFEALNFSI